MNEDGQLLKNADKIKDIPGVIVQGRYDVICPVRSAWDLHEVYGPKENCIGLMMLWSFS
jgi:proline iminopeptidase